MKGETTFTPGPWVNEDADNPFLVTAGRDKRGAYIYVADCGWVGVAVSEDEEAGNLALVKAAPTLHAALVEAEAALAVKASLRDSEQARVEQALESVRSALAAALPESREGASDE